MIKTIGVIGGGQLARMMIPAAESLGIELKVLAESEDSSAKSSATMVGDYNDLAIVRAFAKTVDVITFDHEHVPLPIIETLEAEGFSFQPSSNALKFAQNKLEMRKRLTELGLPMPAWAKVNTEADVQEFLDGHGGVAVLKTPAGGYDGKGVMVVRSVDDAKSWLSLGKPLLIEEKVNFVRELAQLSARNVSGEWKSWPVVQTVQRDGVCSEALSPAPNADQIQAAMLAKRISEGLQVTGNLAVEMFETESGILLINELAMRPHNSGHFSIEGSRTSQFEQHLRAVADLALGDTTPTKPFAVMVNLLGVDDNNTFVEHYTATLEEAGVYFHGYGKTARKGRKMAHITVLSDESIDKAREIALEAKRSLHA